MAAPRGPTEVEPDFGRHVEAADAAPVPAGPPGGAPSPDLDEELDLRPLSKVAAPPPVAPPAADGDAGDDGDDAGDRDGVAAVPSDVGVGAEEGDGPASPSVVAADGEDAPGLTGADGSTGADLDGDAGADADGGSTEFTLPDLPEPPSLPEPARMIAPVVAATSAPAELGDFEPPAASTFEAPVPAADFDDGGGEG